MKRPRAIPLMISIVALALSSLAAVELSTVRYPIPLVYIQVHQHPHRTPRLSHRPPHRTSHHKSHVVATTHGADHR